MSLSPVRSDSEELFPPKQRRGDPLKGAARGVSEAAGHLRGRTATALIAKAGEHQQAAKDLFASTVSASSTARFQERRNRLALAGARYHNAEAHQGVVEAEVRWARAKKADEKEIAASEYDFFKQHLSETQPVFRSDAV